jgi:hypothetical protein
MHTFRQAIIDALHQCHRDRVKPIARNIAVRLPSEFSFSSRYVEIELSYMIRDGLVERPTHHTGKPKRYGYIPKVDYCPYCHQVIPPMALAHAN